MNNGRILVVEDEKDIRDGLCELLCRNLNIIICFVNDIRDGLCELLCREGYMVAACENAAQAKRYMADGGAKLYLLDVMLPDGRH